jgi:hypothetical protein
MSSKNRLSRRLAIALGVLAVLALALLLAWHLALQRLRSVLLDALGPRASVGAIVLHWNELEVQSLRIAADRGGPHPWPADDELRAERVTLRPDLRAVLSGRWRVGELEVDGGALSLLRDRAGRLHVLPALLERPPSPPPQQAKSAAAAPLVAIDHIVLRDGTVDFFDASVRRPPLHLQLAQLQAEIDDLRLPALDTPLRLQLDARLPGPQHEGRLRLGGTLTPATHDAQLRAQFDGVDLVSLQPYLLKVAEGGIRHGTLDLRLDANVRHDLLKAPGELTLHEVELGHGGTLGGVPQRAVLAAMARNGRIDLRFTLAGRLDDPNFSLNENLATRVGSALAEQVGVSVGGVVQGMGSLVKGLFGK